jgi:hypothetical protein
VLQQHISKHLPVIPLLALLGIYPRNETQVIPKAKLRKQPRCPTTDEWIKKIWYLYTVEFYSATKRNEVLSFASK